MATGKIKDNECEFCGYKYDEESMKIGQEIGDADPCYCEIIKLIYSLRTKNKKLKKKIKDLKQEVSYLNELLADADDGGWDAKALYIDARDGLFNGNKINEGCKPDKKYAEFIARRYNLEIDKEGEII